MGIAMAVRWAQVDQLQQSVPASFLQQLHALVVGGCVHVRQAEFGTAFA